MRGDDGRPFPGIETRWRKIETRMYPMATGVHAGTNQDSGSLFKCEK